MFISGIVCIVNTASMPAAWDAWKVFDGDIEGWQATGEV